jgi:hypothetical protein
MTSPTPVMPQVRVLLRRSRGALGLRARRPRPHFLGIGTQKGGTTTLYQMLKPHPEVFLPENKEVHYFTKHYSAGEDWYVGQFEAAGPGQLRGEITPYYLFHEAAPERIHALRHDMRLIALLRDPVERTLSQYFHSRRLGLEKLPLELALAAEAERLADSKSVIREPGCTHPSHQEHSYLARSRYDEQLRRYFALFGRQNVLVLRSEDLFEQPQASLVTLSAFLGIQPFPTSKCIPHANQGMGESKKVNGSIRQSLREELAGTYQWLDKELGLRWD